jgi:hypothetical protein
MLTYGYDMFGWRTIQWIWHRIYTIDMALNYALVIWFDFNGGCYVNGLARTWN